MNKDNYAYIILGVILLLVIIIIVPKYITGNVTVCVGETCERNLNSDIEKIEMIHFYSTNQCYSCRTLGELTEETLNTYFFDELNEGKIVFAHINVDLSENSEKVKKYGATGSSLLIGTYYKNGNFIKEENVNVWYKISNKSDFMNYLKGVIENKLSGE